MVPSMIDKDLFHNPFIFIFMFAYLKIFLPYKKIKNIEFLSDKLSKEHQC